jgi:hypothetical protein
MGFTIVVALFVLGLGIYAAAMPFVTSRMRKRPR